MLTILLLRIGEWPKAGGESVGKRGISEIKAASLQGLAALVSRYGLGSKKRRYCPECLAAQESGLYGHALWDFRVVNACPIHGVRLIQDLCGDSGAGLGPTRKVLLAGICRRCGSIGMRCNSALPSPAEPSEIWVAQQVGDLVAYASSGGVLAREALQRGMLSCSDGFRSNAALARSIGISSHALGAAIHDARQKPALELLLAIASRCGMSLLSIFLGQPAVAAAPAQTYMPPTPVRPTWKLDPAGLDKKICRLTASYRTITSSSNSDASVSKALGVNRRYLALHHPKLWAAIVAAHEYYRAGVVEASYAPTREIVAMAIDKAIESHVPLNEQSITRLVRMEGWMGSVHGPVQT